MLAPGFINYLPNYLAVITVYTIFLLACLSINYMWVWFSNDVRPTIKEYIEYITDRYTSDFCLVVMWAYFILCAISTLIYVMASICSIGE